MGGQCANERVRGKGAGVVTINEWKIPAINGCFCDNARASDGIHLDRDVRAKWPSLSVRRGKPCEDMRRKIWNSKTWTFCRCGNAHLLHLKRRDCTECSASKYSEHGLGNDSCTAAARRSFYGSNCGCACALRHSYTCHVAHLCWHCPAL